MPVTVSVAAWYAVTDGTRAVQVTEARTYAFICSTRATNVTASRETDVFITPPKKCKEKPMIWDEIKED